jgi:protein-disulfide isomerase
MSLKMLRAALAALPLLIVACDGAKSENGAKTPAAGATAASVDQARDADMTLGSPDAPVTLIEYASVTCPACAAFHEMALPAIKENYIDTGKVRYVFREFPTPPQPLSVAGSVMARCAADRGGADAYFAVVGALLKTQQTWIRAQSPRSELLKIAAQAGMDETAFDACLQRQEFIDLINENVRIGSTRHDVSGTPSFVVDGETQNLRSFDDLTGALDAALAKKGG